MFKQTTIYSNKPLVENHANNFHFNAKSKIENIERYLEIALDGKKIEGIEIIRNKKFTNYHHSDLDGNLKIILYWHGVSFDSPTYFKFPVGLTGETLGPIIKEIINDEYPKMPDLDGSCSKGFYITTGEFWNFLDEYGSYSLAMITPCWMYHHK